MVTADELQNIGLTHNEAVIYLALLETGETKTGALAKKTHLHRVLIYDALESLIQKGLASYCIKENIKYFQGASPQTILKFIDEKKESAKQMMPTLEAMNQHKNLQSVVVYESTRGIKSAIMNMLESLPRDGTNVCFGSGNMLVQLGEGFYNIFQTAKTQKQIKSRILFDKTFKKNAPQFSKGTIVRYIALGPFAADTWVYSDKVLIINYNASPMFAILITSKDTAQTYQSMFENYWKIAK